ncbi:phosphoribosylamine--glycine ligase [Halobacteriales archaeon QS_1_68_20]|nr:MAG: phosphoribosylamine--glycine ligase [Halobacteriales archaeon QS_1_68_20]
MTETVLLVGGGGREHAIARALAATGATLYACAGNRNPGIARLADGFAEVEGTDVDGVVEYADEVGATLAVVGPEGPLAAGLVDVLEDAGVYAFGPRQAEARIETDKAWQRQFMREQGISGCPDFETFENADAACEYLDTYDGDVAVKPRGLTGGKGVRVTGDQLSKAEATEYVRESGYDEWVIEERLVGEEFTVQAFVANGSVRVSPAVQDHKRAYEGDEGPNTGGMGSYSDAGFELPFMTEDDYDEAARILRETVDALPEYRGILYGQFMLTADGPKVVEFNARFGDPEAMNTLPVMRTEFLDVLTAARDGEELPPLEFDARATVCKYGVPEGYPTDPQAGTKLTIDEESVGEALLFYASVDEREDGIYTTTSRAFAVVGVAESIGGAEKIAESALESAPDGVRVRHDVGKPEVVGRRVDHMQQLRGE